MKIIFWGKGFAVAVVAAAIVLASTRVVAGQGQPIEQRIGALEAGQQEILKELKELKLLLQQLRLPQPPPTGAPVPQQPTANTANPAAPQLPNFDLLLAGSPSKGKAEAKIVIIEFSDFECPFCGRYARDTYGQVVKEFVDTGKIRYVFRQLPIETLHPRALRAAEAGECAHGQGRFWEFHDRLFNNQQMLTEPDLMRHAQALTLNMPAFEKCMAAQLASPAKVRQDQNEGGRAGVTGTPTFFLGTVTKEGRLKPLRRMVGAHPIENFRTAINTLLAETK